MKKIVGAILAPLNFLRACALAAILLFGGGAIDVRAQTLFNVQSPGGGGAITAGTTPTLGFSAGTIPYSNGSVIEGAANFTIDGGANPNVATGHSYDVNGAFFASVDSNSNVSVGSGAGNFGTNTGNINTSIGHSAGAALTSGFQDTLIGDEAGRNLTTGNGNASLGSGSLQTLTDGVANTAVGAEAMGSGGVGSDHGNYNTAVGNSALAFYTTGANYNVAVGVGALGGGGAAPGLSGANNVAVGGGAMPNLQSGNSNVSIGFSSSDFMTAGTGNVAVGQYALYTLTSTPTYNTAIGYGAGNGPKTGSQNIFIGYASGLNYSGAESYDVLIGCGGTAGESNIIRICDGNQTLRMDYGGSAISTWTFAQKIAVPGGATPVLTTTSAVTTGAGSSSGTLTNAPAVGNPTKWIPISDNGTTRYVPAW